MSNKLQMLLNQNGSILQACMNEIESMTRQLGDAFGPKWPGAATHKTGAGFMLWHDDDHCIFADFFGDYETDDKIKLAIAMLETHQASGIPYSLRIGFHKTEEAARITMMELYDARSELI